MATTTRPIDWPGRKSPPTNAVRRKPPSFDGIIFTPDLMGLIHNANAVYLCVEQLDQEGNDLNAAIQVDRLSLLDWLRLCDENYEYRVAWNANSGKLHLYVPPEEP